MNLWHTDWWQFHFIIWSPETAFLPLVIKHSHWLIVFSSLHSQIVDCLFITSQSNCWLSFRHFTVRLLIVLSSLHSQFVDCPFVTSLSICWQSFGHVAVKLLIVRFVTSQSICWLFTSLRHSQIVGLNHLIAVKLLAHIRLTALKSLSHIRRTPVNSLFRSSFHQVKLLTLPASDPDVVDAHLIHGVSSVGKGQRAMGANSTSGKLLLLQKRKKSKPRDREDDL